MALPLLFYTFTIDIYKLILVYYLSIEIACSSLSGQFVWFVKETSIPGVFSVGPGWARGGHHMTSARISRVWGTILLTITIFLVNIAAQAQTSQYIFLSDKSVLVQT